MVSPTLRFIQLVEDLVSGETDAQQFADSAVDFWQQEFAHLQADTPENRIIGELCLEADALSNEPPYDSTPDQLRAAARQALADLLELQKEHNP